MLIQVDGDLWVKRIITFCITCIILIGAADFFLVYLEMSPSQIMARSFNVALEETVGTWFSSNQALLAGLVAAGIFMQNRTCGPKSVKVGWALVALFFVFISLDDTAKIHERLGTLLRLKYEQATDAPLLDWFPSWGWQLFVAPFFAFMGVYILWFLWNAVDTNLRVWVLVALGLLSIAVGLDFIEGLDDRLSGDDPKHLMQLLEEILEMFGTTAFLFVFLSTLNSRVTFYLKPTQTRP